MVLTIIMDSNEVNIAKFPIEISNSIKLPSYSDIKNNLTKEDIDINNTSIKQRAKHEVLLRLICRILIESCINSDRSCVVDLGAWIGDNSIVWAKMISDYGGKVIAIDPLINNIEWMNTVTALNKINNHISVGAICSKNQSKYTVSSFNKNQGSFKEVSTEDEVNPIVSTTVDSIVFDKTNLYTDVLLLHIDVEGMELEVLQGSELIIKNSQPFIIFENHILSEAFSLQRIRTLLANYGYETFMINEVLLGNNLDCRNFIAFPKNSDEIKKEFLSGSFSQSIRHPMIHVPAIPGGIVVPI